MNTLGWIAVAGVVAYIIECFIWPYRTCRLCKGTGRLRSPLTRSWRDCNCGGDGQAIRWGRRVWQAFTRAF